MAINWKKVKEKAVDLAIDGSKSFVKQADKNVRNIEKTAERKAKQKGVSLSGEIYEKLDDMYDSIDNAYDLVYDLEEKYHSKYKNPCEEDYFEEDYTDESDDEQYDLNYDENTRSDFSERCSKKLTEEELKVKVEEQISLSSITYELDKDDFIKRDKDWYSLGALKSVETESLSKDEAGLLRLKVNEQVVYIVRVIEIKSGGFSKKVEDFKNITNISNRKLREKVFQNLDSINIEILCIGKKTEDVDLVRALEKDMIKYYKPEWN